jgi:hypothetical protein
MPKGEHLAALERRLGHLEGLARVRLGGIRARALGVLVRLELLHRRAVQPRALERGCFPSGGVLAIGLELGDLAEQRRALLWGMEGGGGRCGEHLHARAGLGDLAEQRRALITARRWGRRCSRCLERSSQRTFWDVAASRCFAFSRSMAASASVLPALSASRASRRLRANPRQLEAIRGN